jgi:iron complex outermembrane receptor protein
MTTGGKQILAIRQHVARHAAASAFCVLAGMAADGSAVAGEQEAALPDVVVSASRSEQRRFDAPAAVDSVPVDPLRAASPLVNLSEVLTGVPGVAVRDRQNYAQDLQLSVRGFGTRSTFGVRGVRLYVDGIPATMPDGQGQAATADLANASRVEVLRGPFAQMYGNASGGVVQVFTPDPPKDGFTGRASTGIGSDGQWQAGVALGGGNDKLGGTLDAWTYQTDGYRDHSAARRYQLNAKVAAQPTDATRVTGQFNYFNQPLAQDPLGLTRAQADANPRQAVPAATLFDTGKTVEQTQGGVVVDHKLTEADSLQGRLYAGTRQLNQRLGMSGIVATSSGGIVDLDRTYGGAALSWTRRTTAGGLPLQWTAGVEANGMRDGRTGFVNNNGTQGALRRDETDKASDFGAFAQFDWTFRPSWELVGGVRASRVKLSIDDHYITTASPDDSGSTTYNNVSPVLGMVWHALDTLNVYANLGRGFESPTLTEVAYGPGGSGSNLGLQASTSRQGEIGVKWQQQRQRLEAALFDADSHDEVVPLSNNAGRTVYQNVNGVHRRGMELAWRGGFGAQVGASADGTAGSQFEAGLAYTYLSAYFGESFLNAQGQTVNAGNRLPGTARHSLNLDIAWRPLPPLVLGAEMHVDSLIYADDLNTQAAPGYATFNLRAGYEFRIGKTRLFAFGRIDNVTDRKYIGSVIVNEANGRYFEPAPGRRFFVGLRAAM